MGKVIYIEKWERDKVLRRAKKVRRKALLKKFKKFTEDTDQFFELANTKKKK